MWTAGLAVAVDEVAGAAEQSNGVGDDDLPPSEPLLDGSGKGRGVDLDGRAEEAAGAGVRARHAVDAAAGGGRLDGIGHSEQGAGELHDLGRVGDPVRGVLVAVYAISAALATVAGIIATARLSAGDPSTVGILVELDAIAAVVIGGTPLSGGKVSIAGTVVGALVVQVITATFIMNDLPYTYAQILKAAIILLAVYIQRGRGSV